MLGVAGSLHCIGMCGPLSLALPIHTKSGFQKVISLLSYQVGRIITYTLLGFLIGIAGRPLQLGQYQQTFSIVMGSLIILAGLFHQRASFMPTIPGLNKFFNRVQLFIAKRLKTADGVWGFFSLGMANGWLPCGLVYVALASTFSIGEVLNSMSFMAAFGAGTIPAMLLVGLSGQLIKPEARISFQKAVPYFIMFMGLLLIIRGLNLGIPYLSPMLPSAAADPVNCHPA